MEIISSKKKLYLWVLSESEKREFRETMGLPSRVHSGKNATANQGGKVNAGQKNDEELAIATDANKVFTKMRKYLGVTWRHLRCLSTSWRHRN